MNLSQKYINAHINTSLLAELDDITESRCSEGDDKLPKVTARLQLKIPVDTKISSHPIHVLYQPCNYPEDLEGARPMNSVKHLRDFNNVEITVDEFLDRVPEPSVYVPDLHEVQSPSTFAFDDASMIKDPKGFHPGSLRQLPTLLTTGNSLRGTKLGIWGLARAVAYGGPAGKLTHRTKSANMIFY